jgi:hypothetical protein
MKEFKLSDLVLDYSIYPRKEIDSQHAAILQEAIEGGAVMPPLVLETKTHRVVDGFHRYRAFKRIAKDNVDFMVSCIEKTYKSEALLFLDAMRYNAEHGRALNKFDRTHCIIMAHQLSVSDKDIAKVLHVQVEAVKRLIVDRTATGVNGKQKLVPIKSTIRHMAGQKMTTEQVACNDKLGGMQQGFYVHQIILLIESGLLDLENERLMEQVKHLHELLEGVLVVK